MVLVQPDSFRMTVSRALGRVVLTLHGDLDTASAPMLRSSLRDLIEEQGNLDVIIDMAQLEFIDSQGLSVLLAGDRMAKARGGNLTLSAPRPRVHKVFEITGLDQHFTMTQT